MSHAFTESPERLALRQSVAAMASKYGESYFYDAAISGRKTTELWSEAGKLGFLGVSIPEEYGGGGGEIGDLAAVCEELAAAGCPLLMMVVSPAIVGTLIAQYGTEAQKHLWLPGLADGTATYAFSITEADAGSNSHNLSTVATRSEDGWIINGNKTFISGVDEASHVLVIGRTEDAKTGKLKPAVFMVPTNAEGFVAHEIDMALTSPEKQFTLFFDNVRVGHDALIGSEDSGLELLFAGLNPERIMAASMGTGTARWAISKAVSYAKDREVWGKPIGAHQAISHPLAKLKIELEMTRLLTQKAAALLADGDLLGAGEAANMAKYSAGEVASLAVDQAIQTHGGNGLSNEYGLAQALVSSRLSRIAPVSREMALNFVAQFSLGLPKSY